MEKTLGPEHPDTLWTANLLATLLNEKGDSPAAVFLLRQVAGKSAACLAGVRYNLACYECLSGNQEEAKRLIADEIAAKPSACDQAFQDDALTAIHDFMRQQQPASLRDA